MIFLFLVLAYCYLRQGELVDRAGKKMITVGFPVLLMIFVCKLIYPELMVNGMMGAVGAGVIFLSFESHISELDVLTRQGNLSAFLDYMDMLLEEKSEFDIFMVGSRNFSDLNSVVGFGEGNRILCRLSDWLEKELPKSRIFRTSASSFAAVLVGKDRLRKQDWQTLCSSFPTVMKKEEVSYRVVPYFAVYHYDGREKTAAKILEALEYVGKTAKQEKGGLLEFDQGMRVKMGKRDEVLKCLYSSLKKHRFEIWYQPIFHVASGRFRSAEALIRLKDGKGEYIPPDEFIPTAEQTGLIEEISMQRQRGILAVLKETTSEELEYVSVNLADQQLQTGYYLAEMDRIAREWGVGA